MTDTLEIYLSDGERYNKPLTPDQEVYLEEMYKKIYSLCRFARENQLDVMFNVGNIQGYCCTLEYELCLIWQLLFGTYHSMGGQFTAQQRQKLVDIMRNVNELVTMLGLEDLQTLLNRIWKHYQYETP